MDFYVSALQNLFGFLVVIICSIYSLLKFDRVCYRLLWQQA